MAVKCFWLDRKEHIKSAVQPSCSFFSQSEVVLPVTLHLTNSRYASGSCMLNAFFLLGTVDYVVHVPVGVCDGITLKYMQR